MLSCNTTLYLPHDGSLLQVRMEHDADNITETTIPWAAVLEQRKASCNGRESVQLLGTFTG
jgi:hypothetical protein